MLDQTDRPVVLLIEDEALLLLSLEEALEEAGFDVVGAPTGEIALTQFDASPMRFDAVISDIRLGKGIDGWTVVRHCRQAKSTLAVIYMSGDSANAWPAQGVPGSLMLSKPFVAAQVITGLSTLLTEASHAASIAAGNTTQP